MVSKIGVERKQRIYARRKTSIFQKVATKLVSQEMMKSRINYLLESKPVSRVRKSNTRKINSYKWTELVSKYKESFNPVEFTVKKVWSSEDVALKNYLRKGKLGFSLKDLHIYLYGRDSSQISTFSPKSILKKSEEHNMDEEKTRNVAFNPTEKLIYTYSDNGNFSLKYNRSLNFRFPNES